MVNLSGRTVNGDTYEGIYANASPDRITWSATFRRNGVFFGMRHGRINGLLSIPSEEVDDVVKDDIEEAWFN
jgi:hypothetical protein